MESFFCATHSVPMIECPHCAKYVPLLVECPEQTVFGVVQDATHDGKHTA